MYYNRSMIKSYKEGFDKNPTLGKQYVWDNLKVTIINIESQYIEESFNKDGSIMDPYYRYMVTLEYIHEDGSSRNVRTSWSSWNFKSIE